MVISGAVRVSEHGYDELVEDKLTSESYSTVLNMQ